MSRVWWVQAACCALMMTGCVAETAEEALSVPEPEGDVCEEAIAIMEMCLGEAPEAPPEGCVGDFRATSEGIVAGGCDALDTGGGKADASGFWCLPLNRWMGLCRDEITLAEAAAIPGLVHVCPSFRSQDLCDLLEAAESSNGEARLAAYEEARDLVSAELRSPLREEAQRDPVIQYFIRERTMALLAWHVVTRFGTVPVDGFAFEAAADEALVEHFPAYEPGAFPMARAAMPPLAGAECDVPREALVIFPGVVRLLDRNEFAEQAEVLDAALPCLDVRLVNTGSFVDPEVNASQARELVSQIDADLGPVPLHLLGYSQGARNALQTLAEHEDIAARTRSVLTLNSAAHGSEVAELLFEVIDNIESAADLCDELPEFAVPTCQFALSFSPRPAEKLIELITFAMGLPPEQIEDFLDAEDDIAASPTMAAFLVAHLPGIFSLTPEATLDFWGGPGASLPKHALYFSFRSVISDTRANLPSSNALFHHLLNRAGGSNPYNDMQVRLSNQSLGGHLTEVEIVSPVAEGNHWQWELSTGAVPGSVMPPDMTDRIPHRELLLAYYQALYEAGVLLAD